MTLGAVWITSESGDGARFWGASDSRISDAAGTLIDEGVKLFAVPIRCHTAPPDGGFLDHVYHSRSVALLCAGGSIQYQNIHGLVSAALQTLVSHPSAPYVPSMLDVAAFVADICTRYVRSLGSLRPDLRAELVTVVVGGWCPRSRGYVAFEIEPKMHEGMWTASPVKIDMSDGNVHFIGSDLEKARQTHEAITNEQPVHDRLAIRTIRTLIADDTSPSIGGHLQLGYTMGDSFHRVWVMDTEATDSGVRAVRQLNGIDLDTVSVGLAMVGVQGLATF